MKLILPENECKHTENTYESQVKVKKTSRCILYDFINTRKVDQRLSYTS